MPPLPVQKSELTVTGSLSDGWKRGWRVHRNTAADETWDEKKDTCRLCNAGEEGAVGSQDEREGGRDGQRESRHLRVMGGSADKSFYWKQKLCQELSHRGVLLITA